jgi:predicted aspartyl protease
MLPLPPAEFDNKLAIGGDAIAARQNGTGMSVDVMVNGRGPYKFIVDSGADTSVVGVRIARDLQLPLGTPVVLNDMTGRNLVDRVKVDRLHFGPSTVANLEVPALGEQNLGSDGVLGIDALAQQRLMMDFEKRLIKVEDARSRTPHFAGEIVITARRSRGQLILTRVRAAGVRLNAVVDTGSEMTIGNLALRDKLMRKKPARFSTATLTGVTGKSIVLQIAVIPELELGPITLRNVPIAFADVPPFKVFGLDREPSLLLGTDILQTFRRISLDFRARKVRFQLKRCGGHAVSIDTSPQAMFTYVFSNGAQDVCGRT